MKSIRRVSSGSISPLCSIAFEHQLLTRVYYNQKDHTMPATKGRKTAKAGVKSQKVIKKTANDEEYQDEADSEDEVASVSSDTNEADMELFRAAFASVKSKNAKKKNAEFLKKNQALIDEARGQAEAMKLAGLAHLEQLMQGFEVVSQPPNNEDISAFANLTASRELFETSKLSIEELATDYEGAFQAAEDEVQKRVQRRERIRRHTIRHTYQILERGIEEQKLITDATNLIKNFQRLMSL
ncbi:unnamed protein product [Rhizoctonia solani]|uniref:Uncharacterized protein n=1 Tax=Rhizoctonia solani TaxID=456999 RepID=A0A8H2XEP9_9AGAM|nr:unnamed protein product [Rhizoctonia solani]